MYITYASYINININIKYNLKQGQVYHTDNSNKVGQMTPAYKLDMFDGKWKPQIYTMRILVEKGAADERGSEGERRRITCPCTIFIWIRMNTSNFITRSWNRPIPSKHYLVFHQAYTQFLTNDSATIWQAFDWFSDRILSYAFPFTSAWLQPLFS